MNAAVDPWVITARERVKYDEQFNALHPFGGMINGLQAKGFFLKSQLSPIVLGQIWALADTDADGMMNLNEFSIACKLINLKLRGFEIPKALPPVLVASLSAVGGTPTRTPTTGLSPLDPLKSIINQPLASTMPLSSQPGILPQAIVPPMSATMGSTMPHLNNMGIPSAVSIPPMIPPAPAHQPLLSGPPPIPPQPLISMSNQQPLIPTQQLISGSQPIIHMQPLLPTGAGHAPPMIPPQPAANLLSGIGIVKPLVEPTLNKINSPSLENIVSTAGAIPTPPSGTPSRSMSISGRAPSIESPGQVEWSIKGPAKLKYTQLFNTTDRFRSGYLSGIQARNIMVQTKLPQAILAQIWGLSDMDSDGRLGCEEFVLAMYLCDMALAGEKIPNVLPTELIPPSFRKPTSRHGSLTGSRHGSISSQGTPSHAVDADPSAGLPQTSFEDKRKENFDKGQAELERRRKALLDIQRKEQEERERKEREEYEKREKARLEQEEKKRQEHERQLQQQREIEMEKEEQRKRALEQKEEAKKELERQRQLEWEKQRIAEMQLQRQREQEKVLKLKAQNQTLNVELSTLNEKIKELSQKICDTRSGVTNVKSVIDGMRLTRDTQMTDMAQLKSRIKDQNAKLVQLSQEKIKFDAKSKTTQSSNSTNQEQMNAAFSNKQIIIKQLKDKLENTKQQMDGKQNDIKQNNIQLTEVKGQLTELINKCEELYSVYDTQRTQVVELKNNRKNDSITSSWDTGSSWPVEKSTSIISSKAPLPTSSLQSGTSGYVKYRSIYEFVARNADEISFQPGDIIMVPLEQNAEPGWLAGEINDHTGWFPESYVEKVESPSALTNNTFNNDAFNDNKRQLEEITEVAETIPNDNTILQTAAVTAQPIDVHNNDGEYYLACYPYESGESGDLTLNSGDMILVTKKEGDWWTGSIGTRSGLFPSNYVQKIDSNNGNELPNYNNTQQPPPPKDEFIKTNGFQQQNQSPPNQYEYQPQPINNIEQSQISQQQNMTTRYSISEDLKISDVDSEVSQINTQPKTNDNNQDYTPMSQSATPSIRAKKPEIAQVIAPYESTSTEQLSLSRGQLIMIRKKTDSGWWEGELQAKGKRRQIGWFPATYVKVLQGGRNSGRNTPVSASKIEMSETILDKVIALYPYKSQNDDELSFDKDDIISVLGRDEPEWWRGELNGITGLIPSNYVGPFVSSGNV